MRKFLKKTKALVLHLLTPFALLRQQVFLYKCRSNATVAPTATIYLECDLRNRSGDPSRIVIGDHTHVRGQLELYWGAGEIRIGDWCYIGKDSRLWSQESIIIGNHVLISHNVEIHDTNAHPVDFEDRRKDAEHILSGKGWLQPTETLAAPIVIEDDAWIGFRSVILKGVHIGRGAIVAAGSVVTKDVEAWTVVAGNPARVVKTLTPSQ